MSETTRRTLLIVALLTLTVGGAVMRVYDLGALSFFGDEETTAFAARSVAQGEGSVMPSGMPYRRALPYTWLNAMSARVIGLDSELAYRLPAALLGAATVPLLFLIVSAMVGPGAGLVAAMLLALSGWHLVWSRTARMYVPALLAALAFFYIAWQWHRTGRFRAFAASIGLYLLAVFMHSGSAAVALFPVLFALLYDGRRVSFGHALLATALMASAGWALDRLFVVAPYEHWASGFSSVASAPSGRLLAGLSESASSLPAIAWLALPAGALIGWQWARVSGVFATGRTDIRNLAVALLAALAVSTAFAGIPVIAGSLGVAALVLDGRGGRPWWRLAPAGLALIGSAAAIVVRVTLGGTGPADIARYPFPYLPYLATLMPAFVIVFLIHTVRLAVAPARPGTDDMPIRAAVLYAIAYCLALGLAVPYAPWRYLLPVYPWMVIVVAAAIRDLVGAVSFRTGDRHQIGIAAAAGAAIFIGVLGGHGAPATRTVLLAEHGSRVPWNDQGQEIRPDHRSPGHFVLRHSKPGDIVIGEDALELRWYAGQTDYWFRSLDDAGRYLYRDENDILRDIYVGAALLDGAPEDDVLRRTGVGVWFVTSGETAMSRTWYLSAAQATWLDSLQASTKPVFIGEDETTAVYCFGNCP